MLLNPGVFTMQSYKCGLGISYFVESVAGLQKYFYTLARFGSVISQLSDIQNVKAGEFAGTGFLIITTSDNFFPFLAETLSSRER
jgi:hypothetical protein